MPRSITWPDRLVKPPFGSVELDRGHPLSRGLVGCWLFNEGGGKYALDLAGGNTGTLTNGPTWTPGKFGQALNFDGSNDYVDMGSITALSTNKATLVCWWKRNSYTDTMLVGPFHTPYRFLIQPWSEGILYVSAESGVANWASVAYSTLGWHHFVLVYDGTQSTDATKALLYIDGVLQTLSAWHTAVTTSLVTSNFKVAVDLDSTTYRFGNGPVDNVRIYNRALSASEVLQSYQEPYANLRPIVHRRYFVPAGISRFFSMPIIARAEDFVE